MAKLLTSPLLIRSEQALWLFIAFFWGVIRLMSALNDTPRDQDLWTKTAGQNRGNWSFGQVVSLVLLVAPLMTLLDYFDQGMSLFIVYWLEADI